MVFLPPLGGVSRLSLAGSSPCIPCRRSFCFQGAVLDLAIKIATQQPEPDHPFRDSLGSGSLCSDRKLKTCSGSFGSRAGTLSKYVILNCWDRLPQKSSRVNKKFREHATFGSVQENTLKTLAKRENQMGSFCLFVFYQQCLIRFQLHICQPDGSALRGVILATQSVQTGPCRVLGKVEQSHQCLLATLAHQR